MDGKKCSKCGEVLPLEAFGRNRRSKDGMDGRCKECRRQYSKENAEARREYSRQYYQDNLEKIKEYSRQYRKDNAEKIRVKSREHSRRYRKDNLEKIKEREKQYRKENKETLNEKSRRYQKDNAEKIKERQRQWRKDNPEKVKAAKHKRRALKKSSPGHCTTEQLQARLDYHDNRCVYCGSAENIEVEHKIPLAKGGSNWPANLAPACGSCNRSKGDRLTFVEFRAMKQAEIAAN
jgi:5-methylcytosine-specific restriction endonuclease McrA